ncbi:hypothetical protein SAMN02927924_00340 [Sphingobium faniae]|nr:hypothetical protein SAMN02927924_00340 [Sphingobium faniae]
MMKLIAYGAAADSDRVAYRKYVHDDILPALIADRPDIAHCTVNLVDDALTGGLPGAKMGAEDVDAGSPYDLVVEFWTSAGATELPGLIERVTGLPGRIDAYWVEEFAAKDSVAAQSAPPVLRLISPCWPKKGMALPQVFRHWQEHVEKANRVHVGMSRYIRNWHMASLTPDAPAYFGAPMLSFQTMEDWTDRFYVDAPGGEEIAADVGSFVESFTPMLTREFRLK